MAALSQPASVEIRRIKAMENRARRVARSEGLAARKSRNRYIHNEGEFRLIHAASGVIITGNQYNLTAAEVIDFCLNTWPEESKNWNFSCRWEEHPLAAQKIYLDPIFFAMAKALTASALAPPALTQLEPPYPNVFQVPVAAAQAEPAQLEPRGEVRSSQAEVELEKYRKYGFRNGPKDLEFISRPDWIFTFAEVCQEFKFKTERGVAGLAKNSDYPPLALQKRLITRIGCDILKAKQQQDRILKRQLAYEHAKKAAKPQTSQKQISLG
jgi:hypothetical protein